MINFCEFNQNTDEWQAAHLCRMSASSDYKLMFTEGVYLSGANKGFPKYEGKEVAEKYVRTKVRKVFQNSLDDKIETFAMKRGHTLESIARSIYCSKMFLEQVHINDIREEFERLSNIENEKGILLHSFSIYDNGNTGIVSPDGWVPSEKKTVEIKCLESDAFTEAYYLKNASEVKSFKKEYYWQMIRQMIAMNATSADFVNYSDKFEENKCMSILTIKKEEVLEDFNLMTDRLAWAKDFYYSEYKKITSND